MCVLLFLLNATTFEKFKTFLYGQLFAQSISPNSHQIFLVENFTFEAFLQTNLPSRNHSPGHFSLREPSRRPMFLQEAFP